MTTFLHINLLAMTVDGDEFEFEIESGDSSDLPPGLTFDRTTGWLTGFFPDQGATETRLQFCNYHLQKRQQSSCKRSLSVLI
jgi:hypothetical protein